MTTEAHIEQATIEWLQDLGYIHKLGKTLPQNNNEVVLKDVFTAFIKKQYSTLPEEIQKLAIADFINNTGAILEHRNRDFHLKLTKGIPYQYKTKEGEEKAAHIYPVDFENPENNTFWAVNQFSII
ncbi:MAG: type I restriction endonuclease subunit R, partial [Flavobacteriaceae bacterium]|nr:type I restriction endonuclease subunit R [Flavobacteriaceae bacterium]